MTPQFGPSHMEINLDYAPIGVDQLKLPGQILLELKHKQLKIGFSLIGAYPSGAAWF